MRPCLAPLGIKLVGLIETNATVPDVDENGKTLLENARIKALAYYKALKRLVFACDSGLYLFSSNVPFWSLTVLWTVRLMSAFCTRCIIKLQKR
jgi:hypothetical protein